MNPAEFSLSTKICPNCGAEVPDVANLCKHCFHDFHMVVPKRKSPLFPILLFLNGTAIVTALTYGYVHDQQRTFKISVDQETQSIVFTTTYSDHTEANRVFFKDVAQVEYVMNAKPRPFEVALVTTNGGRFVYQQADEPLDYAATQLGSLLERPVVRKDQFDAPTSIKKK